jgi:hypothetical protein
MLNRQGGDVQWPGALTMMVMFAAVAYLVPRVLKIVGNP